MSETTETPFTLEEQAAFEVLLKFYTARRRMPAVTWMLEELGEGMREMEMSRKYIGTARFKDSRPVSNSRRVLNALKALDTNDGSDDDVT